MDDLLQAGLDAFPDHVSIGQGTTTSFTELNRRRPTHGGGLGFVTHTTNALVHDASDGSVMQTLDALRPVAETVRHVFPDCDYLLGPSGIAEPTGIFGLPGPAREASATRVAMAQDDPRARGLFGASYLMGFGASLFTSKSAPSAATFGEITGPRGVCAPGDAHLHPAFHTLLGLARASGSQIFPTETKANQGREGSVHGVRALAYQSGATGRGEVWVANTSTAPCSCRLLPPMRWGGDGQAWCQQLDCSAWQAARTNPEFMFQDDDAQRIPLSRGGEGGARAVVVDLPALSVARVVF